MRKKHGSKGIAICVPNKRDKQGFVLDWELLQIAADIGNVEEAIKHYEADGFLHVVPISLDDDVEIREKLAAKYFRVKFDQNFIARFIINSEDLQDREDD